MIPVVTPQQLRIWDAAAEAAGIPMPVLMERAGTAVADAVVARFDALARRGVLVLCGTGNNGGDGWVAARVLHERGYPVAVVESAAAAEGVAANARDAALHADVKLIEAAQEWPAAAVAVDALLGAGAVGPLRTNIAELLARLRRLDLPVVAVDAPSGLDLATGIDHGAVRAEVSVTFGAVRRGHLLARDLVGDLVVADIGMPSAPDQWPHLVTRRWASQQVTPFPARAHKGTRGRVVVIGGQPSMAGAVRLAARAAFGAGAGLVHAVVPPSSLMVMRTAEPDVQVSAGEFGRGLDDDLRQLVERADATVIGPGYGRDDASAAFVLEAVRASQRTVIDADALAILAPHVAALRAAATDRTIVLTPHIGEFRMLFRDCPVDVEHDPWAAAMHAAELSGCTVLLKGVPTVVASTTGQRTIAAGNPGLATGGSGDVLSGIIGTLLAQGFPGADAAAVGAQALGDAADHAARRHTVRAMRPMDVVRALPDVWRAWSRIDTRVAALPFTLPMLPTT